MEGCCFPPAITLSFQVVMVPFLRLYVLIRLNPCSFCSLSGDHAHGRPQGKLFSWKIWIVQKSSDLS